MTERRGLRGTLESVGRLNTVSCVLAAAATAGCSFQGASPADAGEVGIDRPDCGLNWAPAFFEPCNLDPSPALTIANDAILDTDALTLIIDGNSVTVSTQVLDALDPPVAVL